MINVKDYQVFYFLEEKMKLNVDTRWWTVWRTWKT